MALSKFEAKNCMGDDHLFMWFEWHVPIWMHYSLYPFSINAFGNHILCVLLISFSFSREFFDIFYLPPSHTIGSFNHNVRRSIVPIALIISRLARSNQQSNCFHLNLYYIIGVCPAHIIHMTFCRRISMSMILPNSHAHSLTLFPLKYYDNEINSAIWSH